MSTIWAWQFGQQGTRKGSPVSFVADEPAAHQFLRVARAEITRARHTALLEREGPLGQAWRTPAGAIPLSAFA